MTEPNPALAAATLILLRPAVGAPEILMVERGAAMAFAAGAMVFPGGRVDPVDLATAADDEDLAHRLAAVRETAEETGIAVDPQALHYFARWLPNHSVARRFDTRFYIAEAPPGACAIADGSECVRALWIGAAAALALSDAGRFRLIYPTRRTLERLALYPDLAAAQADADRYPPAIITPWRDGDLLRIPDGLGYPVTAERVSSAERG